MITADQILCHLFGDYLLQSDYMAARKKDDFMVALVHAVWYTIPFVFLRPSWATLAFVCITHFVIDHWGLARYLVYAKNFIAPRSTRELLSDSRPQHDAQSYKVTIWWHPWKDCEATGYHKDRPAWLAVWLLIIADNALHILCNGLAFYFWS